MVRPRIEALSLPTSLLRNGPFVVETVKNPAWEILRINPVRVSQQSLGSSLCGAPQVKELELIRTPTGFHIPRFLNPNWQLPCGTPLGFTGFCADFPGVRRCHGDPRLCCETPLGLSVHGSDVTLQYARTRRGHPSNRRGPCRLPRRNDESILFSNRGTKICG